jgi:RNA polymerase sigma-54 factor
MRLSFGQELRLAQKQILAPRMIQSMEILQLPILALQERIEQEMQENPLLDLNEEDREFAPEDGGEVEAPVEAPPDAPTDEERELVIGEDTNNEKDFERLLNMGEEWPDHSDEYSRPSRGRMEEDSERKHDAIANIAEKPQSLQDYLHDQLGWFELDPKLRAMCDRIIYNLDPSGRLQCSLQDLLGASATAEELELAEEAVRLVQKLDPPGVGSRDLRECLLLQLVPGMPCYEQLKALISNHLEDLEHNRLPLIAKKTGYSMEMIQEAIAEMRSLKVNPGADFASAYIPTVTPDIFVEAGENGYKVKLEEGHTPHLFISQDYRKLLSSGETNPQTKDYIKQKLNSAQWLIDSIEQRRNTLTKVAQAIVDHQKAFLDKGPESIEPLKMQQIADKVGVHVTTVSRAVDDKWIQTPRGIFPLKRFFCGGTVSAAGEEVAWDTVRIKLQELIDVEDKQSPLSDEDIVEKLGAQGITVARRTVTKYRKAMNIPSSRQRREWSGSAEKGASSPAKATESGDEE